MSDLPIRAGAYGPIVGVNLPSGTLQLAAEAEVIERAEINTTLGHYHEYGLPNEYPCSLVVPSTGLYIVESYSRIQVINTGTTKQFWVGTFVDDVVLDWMSGNDGAVQSTISERFPVYDSWSLAQQNQYCSSKTAALDMGAVISLKYATNLNVPTLSLTMMPQIIRLLKVL